MGKIHRRRDTPATPVFLGLSCGSAGKESTCNGPLCIDPACTTQGPSGRSEGINTLISFPSYHRACQCLCNRSPRAQEPVQHHAYCIHTGRPSSGDMEVTQDLITPTAKTPQQEAACLSVQGQDATHASTPSWSSTIIPLLPSSFPLRGPALLLSHAETSCGLL